MLEASSIRQFEWSPLQTAIIDGNTEMARRCIQREANINIIPKGRIIPNLNLLMLAVYSKNRETVEFILNYKEIDINFQDQWGFTALHYATYSHLTSIVNLLISHGASVVLESKTGSTSLDFAIILKYHDLIDILQSQINLENDKNYPKFRNWLCALGAGEYLGSFTTAGYDIEFISKKGLDDEDLNCVGISMNRLGLRKKLKSLYLLSSYYNPSSSTTTDDDREDENEEDDEEEGSDKDEDDDSDDDDDDDSSDNNSEDEESDDDDDDDDDDEED